MLQLKIAKTSRGIYCKCCGNRVQKDQKAIEIDFSYGCICMDCFKQKLVEIDPELVSKKVIAEIVAKKV